MRSAKGIGHTIGLLILIQVACGFLVNFVLLRPLATPPGFLANAAAGSHQLSVAVVLLFATGTLSIGIAIAGWPLFRQYSSTMALWLLSLSVVGLSLCGVQNGAVMSMLSLSQAYAAAGAAADAGVFEALGAVVRSARHWAYITYALVGGGVIFVLYGILYRLALVPRALSALGLVAAMLQIMAYTMPFFGHPVLLLMHLPLGLCYLALALWLMAKGFAEPIHPFRPEAQGGVEVSSV